MYWHRARAASTSTRRPSIPAPSCGAIRGSSGTTAGLFGEADTSGKVGFNVQIDLAALRRHRANLAANMLIWDDPRAYAHLYAEGYGLPNDLWAGDPRDNPYIGFRQMLKVLQQYYDDGIYLKPGAVVEDRRADSETKMDSEFVRMG